MLTQNYSNAKHTPLIFMKTKVFTVMYFRSRNSAFHFIEAQMLNEAFIILGKV